VIAPEAMVLPSITSTGTRVDFLTTGIDALPSHGVRPS
jgi:hypothetical protein